MTAKHTPGPWHFDATDCLMVYAERGVDVADLGTGVIATGERIANAALIAEAPAMLEALRAAQSIEDDMVRNGSMLTAEHEQRSIAAAEMRRTILQRIDN